MLIRARINHRNNSERGKKFRQVITPLTMIVIASDKTGNNRLDKAIARAKENDTPENNGEFLLASMDFYNKSQPTNKYNVAKKEDRTDADGIVHDSKTEMTRWQVLQMLQKSGKITQLERQVSFVLQEKFFYHGEIMQPIRYIADFMYLNISFREKITNYWIVEDSKGVRTSEYKIKKKLFLKQNPHYYFFEV